MTGSFPLPLTLTFLTPHELSRSQSTHHRGQFRHWPGNRPHTDQRRSRVAICGRNEARLREAAGRIGAIAVPADVSREADVLRLVESVIDELGGYNVLINNAAFGHFSPLVELSTEKFNALLATNLTGAMMVARESARHFVSKQVHAGRSASAPNPTKLGAGEIAHTIKSLLTLNDVGFITEATVWATNPR